MAGMVHFFHISPEQYWNLDLPTMAALTRFHEKWVQQKE